MLQKKAGKRQITLEIDEADLIPGRRNDPTSSSLVGGPYGHGNGGLFSRPGVDTNVFSAMALPQMSYLNELPLLDDPVEGGYGGYTSPLFSTLTGVTKGASEDYLNQPTAPCLDGPAAGLTKVCTLTSQFGRYRFHLGDLDLETVGDLRDRHDPVDLALVNDLNLNTRVAPGLTQSAAGILRNEFSRRAFNAGVSAMRFLSQRIWTGNPALSTASNYWKDILGLNTQINQDNKVDVDTSNLCKAMNSDLLSFGSSIINSGVRNIVKAMDSMAAYLMWNARQQGLNPTTWDIVMRPEIWDELTMIWPVNYYQEALLQIAKFTGGQLQIPAVDATDMRDQMRSSMTIPIRGRLWNVRVDEFIPETDVTNNPLLRAGQYASDIYYIPRTVRGAIPVTYLQSYHMDNAIAENIVTEGRILDTFTTDAGLFRWYVLSRNGCIGWNFALRFRLLCHTPQLAGRITDVGYEPLQHFRSQDPSSSYFFDGGRTSGRGQDKFYVEWSTGTPVAF